MVQTGRQYTEAPGPSGGASSGYLLAAMRNLLRRLRDRRFGQRSGRPMFDGVREARPEGNLVQLWEASGPRAAVGRSLPDCDIRFWLEPLRPVGGRRTATFPHRSGRVRAWVERRYAGADRRGAAAPGSERRAGRASARPPGAKATPAAEEEDAEVNPELHLRSLRDRRGQPACPCGRAGRCRGALGGLQPALPPWPARARQDPPPRRDRQLPRASTRRSSVSATRPPSASPTSSSPPCTAPAPRRSSAATAISTSCWSTTSSSSRGSTTPRRSSSTPSTRSMRPAVSWCSRPIAFRASSRPSPARLRDRFEWGLTIPVEPPNIADPAHRPAPPRPRGGHRDRRSRGPGRAGRHGSTSTCASSTAP